MKIGIDARFYGEAGPGRYVSELLRNLELIDDGNDYTIFLKKSNIDEYQPRQGRFRKSLADFHWYTLAEQVVFPLRLYQGNFDLVHFTQINVPLFYLSPFVVTIHDLILHEYPTERGNLLRRFLYRLKRLTYLLVFAKAVYFSRRILVPSQATKDDLQRYYKVRPDKIVVTHEAVDHYPTSPEVSGRVAVLERYGIKKPYLLCLASFYPHKNLKRLVEAFQRLRQGEKFAGQLVLVGKESEFSRLLQNLVERGKVAGVVFPGRSHPQGYLADEEVEVILANAFIYVQPSLKEGFGIPPVEAMVFGVPTVVSDIPCLREMCGEASLYFDPTRVPDIVTQIEKAVVDGSLRSQLRQKGFANVKRFSWRAMAKQTFAVYHKVDI